jgi:hypothetical protein
LARMVKPWGMQTTAILGMASPAKKSAAVDRFASHRSGSE